MLHRNEWTISEGLSGAINIVYKTYCINYEDYGNIDTVPIIHTMIHKKTGLVLNILDG